VPRLLTAVLLVLAVLALIMLGVLESLLLPFWTLLDHLSRMLQRH
jgi:hypothetical protein